MKRKVSFYRADVGTDEADRPKIWDRQQICDQLAQIDWRARGRLHTIKEGEDYLMSLTDPRKSFWVTFVKATQEHELKVEQGGQVRDLDLSAGERPAHLARWVFLPSGVVGVVRDQAAPTMGHVANFLRAEYPELCPKLRFWPLYRGDALQELEAMRDLHLVKMRLSAHVIDNMRATSFRKVATEARSVSGATMLEISMKVTGKNDRLRRPMKDIAHKIFGDMDEKSRIIVHGTDDDGVTHKVNLSKNRFDFEIEISNNTDNDPARSPVFRKIAELWKTHGKLIQDAVGLQLETD